jgi:LmbE family N-acetylglucosaminyl deacetylase
LIGDQSLSARLGEDRLISLPPSGPLLVVSPHLDDAALSCSVLLDRAEAGEILTVFAGEPDPPIRGPWDKLTGFANSAESMAARRREDRDALKESGHRLRYLDLLEYQYAAHPRSASERQAIASAVGGWAQEIDGGIVALPAGAGRRLGPVRSRLQRLMGRSGGILANPDHLFVRDAAFETIERPLNFNVLLYEELPYALDQGADREVLSVTSKLALRAVECSVEVDRDRKAKRIAAYTSQIPHLCPDGTRLDVPEKLPPFERYWYLDLPAR